MQKSDLAQSETIDFAKHPELISSFKTILGEIETVIDVLQRKELDFELLVKTNQGLLQDLRLAINKYPEAEEYYQQYLEEFGDLETLDGFFENPEYVEENRGDFINHFKNIHQCIEKPLRQTSIDKAKFIDYIVIKTSRGHKNTLADKNRITNIRFSPNGNALTSTSQDKAVIHWDLEKDVISKIWQDAPLDAVFSGELDISPDGKFLAYSSLGGEVKVWKIDRTDDEETLLYGHNSTVNNISFSSDGQMLASASDDATIRLWSINGDQLNVLTGHQRAVSKVCFSPNGKLLASASIGGTIRLWAVLEGTELSVLRGGGSWANDLAFSPDGNLLAAATNEGLIRIWSVTKGDELGMLTGHAESINSIAFSRDGNLLASASDDMTIRLWDKKGNELQILRGHKAPVSSLQFSPNGRTIASGDINGIIKLWQPKRIQFVPQGISNDLAQGDDQLSIEDELQAIADVLLLRQLEPPIAVGILGTWGSGKSFGMHLIQQRVNEIRCANRQLIEAWGEGLEEDDPDREKKLSPYVGHIYQIKFNAWSYAKQNLWASLMQQIFSELNQQITFEQQLQEAGVDLLSGGKIWEALEKLNEGDQQVFLQDLTAQQKQKLQAIQDSLQVENALLETINQSKQEQVKDFKIKQEKLQSCKLDFERQKRQIIEQTDTQENLIFGAISTVAKQRIGEPLLERIEEKLKQELKKQNLDSTQVPNFKALLDNAMTKTMEQNAQRISFSLFWQWSQKNWIILVILLILISACIGIPYWVAHLNQPDLITQLTGILVPFLPTIATGNKLLDSFMKWHEESLLALQESQAHLEYQIQRKIENDPQLQKQKQDIENLELELEKESEHLPKSNYVTLSDFLGDRLKSENYFNRLGMINQVQQDLRDVSNKLLPPKEQRDEKIKELFPRGEPRVILYIDDLDRCPPKRVVEVLETVQLLLKTQLFVVVLAVDDRYIARALEEVYSGVLKRRGKPSGIDYLEKIIQIPYRMRPISADTVDKYLSSQIQVIANAATNQATPTKSVQITQQTSALTVPPQEDGEVSSQAQQISNPSIEMTPQSISQSPLPEPVEIEQNAATESEATTASNINEINTIEQSELDLIVSCCQYVDITPRTGKRLINIYKILKIVWQQRQEPDNATKTILFSFLALSGRYPDFMRNLFEEIDTEFQEELEAIDKPFDREIVLAKVYRQVPKSDYHAQREWRKFKSDIRRMLNPNPFHLNKADFYLALSFCFVGDIGYDPDDFSQDPITPVQQ